MEHNKGSNQHSWELISKEQTWQSWSGIAFERVCLKHNTQIQRALGIDNIYTEVATWHFQSKAAEGAQIDLLFDRRDDVINLCEIKFSNVKYTITIQYASQLENKKEIFKAQTTTNKSIHLTFITTLGLTKNSYAKRLVQNAITMDALFAE